MINKIIKNTFLLLILCACPSTAITDSDKVDQDEIYQSYSLIYNDENSTTEARATFRVGGMTGTTLNLVSPSKITFNSLEMESSRILGSSYSIELDNGFTRKHYWLWTDNNKKTYKNTATITSIDFDNPPDEISNSNNVEIEFSGSELSDGEEVKAVIESTSDGQTESAYAYQTNAGANSVTFEEEDLAKLFEGQATLYLERSKSTEVSSGTSKGGSINVTYRTRDVSIQIR